jgi:hypothetical protein
MTEYTNPGPIENNIYVPTHEGIGAITTSQIGGDVDVKSLADLSYYQDKLFGSYLFLPCLMHQSTLYPFLYTAYYSCFR